MAKVIGSAKMSGGVLREGVTTQIGFQVHLLDNGQVTERSSRFMLGIQDSEEKSQFTQYRGAVEQVAFISAEEVRLSGFAGVYAAEITFQRADGVWKAAATLDGPEGRLLDIPLTPIYGGGAINAPADAPQSPVTA